MQEVFQVEKVAVAEAVSSSIGMVVIKCLSKTLLPELPRGYTFRAEIFVSNAETEEAITYDLAGSVSRYIKKHGLTIRSFKVTENRLKGSLLFYRIQIRPNTTVDKKVAKSKEWFEQITNIHSECLANYGFSLTSLSPGSHSTYTILKGM